MASHDRCFAMLGAPASGKGTQGRLLADRLGLPYLSTGAQLRREIEEGSSLGREAKTYLDRNQYVPDALATEMVRQWIARHDEGWVLDGFPRSVPQAEVLLQVAPGFHLIVLDVEKDVLRQRVTSRRECLACGVVTTDAAAACPRCGGEIESRDDDSAEGFAKRYAAYEEWTVPALRFLEERIPVVTVAGKGTREEIAREIERKLS
ncbi:adenylate kinase family protein [Roseibacillus ishigakijimensis]|uniref:Adenylate kinase n=1 Tax=Roseibacillus ishigakijimensis TaxID=454146 RepID=A0A934VI47_9BACT|nr:nucleoside monophosphate kinase [Roseibacillus ishigakijimensis]MBK1834693.1 nucleoside monophosphate kinase [Roseibacillus ishigakijimensis]